MGRWEIEQKVNGFGCKQSLKYHVVRYSNDGTKACHGHFYTLKAAKKCLVLLYLEGTQ